jgi:hypothetical protein
MSISEHVKSTFAPYPFVSLFCIAICLLFWSFYIYATSTILIRNNNHKF